MIEKFTPEELIQLKKEMGIVELDSYKKKDVLKDEYALADELFGDKFLASQTICKHICSLIDVSINNSRIFSRSFCRENNAPSDLCVLTVRLNDICEYKEMFCEILDIMKKHNRYMK